MASDAAGPEIDDRALIAACLAVEDTLIDFRDRHVSVLDPAHGFVVRYRDGRASDIIRLGTRDGLRIAIGAYLRALGGQPPPESAVRAQAGGRDGEQ